MDTLEAQITDTIPRLHQLVPHMRDQLIALREGATLEQARLRFIATVDRLVAEGLGRRTVSRVGDRDAYWAPTQEVLEEAMRLGFVESKPLPSARRYLEEHRHRTHNLTQAGERAAALAESDIGAFYDELTTEVVKAHPYFRQLLVILRSGPLPCPEVSEGEVEEARKSSLGTDHWVVFAVEQINSGPAGQAATVDAVKEDVVSVVRRRFGDRIGERPSAKALAEALNDAFAVAACRNRGLPCGATDLKVLKTWGSQLRLFDQSRYVPGFEHANVIWLAADVKEGGEHSFARRLFTTHSLRVAQAVVDGYRHQAEASDHALAAPYIPIFRVRAEAAYRCGVTRALVDMAIEKIAKGEFPELGVQMWLHLGRGEQLPRSEPVYRRGKNRRYDMTMDISRRRTND